MGHEANYISLMLLLCSLLAATSLRPDAVKNFFGDPKKSLSGVDGVYVFTAGLGKPEAAQNDLSDDWSREVVELRLRHNGIKVLSADDWLKAPGNPELVITVQTMANSELKGLYADSVRTTFTQRVQLERDPSTKLMVPTWESSSFGTVGGVKMKSGIRESIEDQVDSFSNAYLGENPRK